MRAYFFFTQSFQLGDIRTISYDRLWLKVNVTVVQKFPQFSLKPLMQLVTIMLVLPKPILPVISDWATDRR